MIAIASARDWSPFFGASLVGLVRYLSVFGVNGEPIECLEFSIKAGASNLAQARQDLIITAMKRDMTHLLFVDDDMQFQQDMLDYLAKDDLDIVGVNCVRKTSACLISNTKDLNGVLLDSRGKTGIEEVDRTGTGIMLIKLEPLKTILPPWFEIEWVEEVKSYRGEDFYFCRKMREHGLKIHISHDVSVNTGHVGPYVYKFSSYPADTPVGEEQ